ncbi:MAG: CBS domain-containing protein [Paracoccaceae bacterium]|nr:CBS domain-containing protein [Paracoccaceae bacterium]MDE2915152.1 CBS domain-containing protein [Paracoccaceae bacterium]
MNEVTDDSPIAARGAHSGDRPTLFKTLTSLFRPAGETPASEIMSGQSLPEGGIGNLLSLRVEDVAVPKADIVAVPHDLGREELVKVFSDSGFSRLPVFKNSLDHPLGMIHLKDLALAYGFNGKSRQFRLKTLIRPLLFAPPSMPIGVLFQKMQNERKHMALVIDEYGGVDGLVTTEDLVEQVVGEIVDEHDAEVDAAWIEERPGVYLCQARASLEDFQDAVGETFLDGEDDEDIDSLAGLVFMACGRVPVRGEVIPLGKGYEVEIVEADPRRIRRLRIRRTDTIT